jgi:DNA replication protein DnaC
MPDGSKRWFPRTCPCQIDQTIQAQRDQENQERRRKIQKHFTLADVGENLAGASFENWEKQPDTMTAYNEAVKFCNDWPKRKVARRGLLIFGENSGNGKSHLLAAIAKKIDSLGDLVVYINVSILLKRMERKFGHSEMELQILDSMAAADLVCLDDIGLGIWTAIERGKFEDITQELEFHNCTIAATTNLHPEMELEKIIGRRSLDRLTGRCRMVENKGWSYRRKRAAQLMKEEEG